MSELRNFVADLLERKGAAVDKAWIRMDSRCSRRHRCRRRPAGPS